MNSAYGRFVLRLALAAGGAFFASLPVDAVDAGGHVFTAAGAAALYAVMGLLFPQVEPFVGVKAKRAEVPAENSVQV